MKAVRPRFPLVAAGLAVALGCGHERQVPSRRYVVHPGPAHHTTSADSVNMYAFTANGDVADPVKKAVRLVYVPNSRSASVSVIDPSTYKVIRTFATGTVPQHVTPAHDFSMLWVLNNSGNSLTPIDPLTGRDGKRVEVGDPYNMYFTPDGAEAMVIAERRRRIDFRDPHSMKLIQSVSVDCRGLDHIDFTVDDRYAIATCEFSGQLVKIDVAARKAVAYTRLGHRLLGRDRPSMPQDIRASPDGKVFFVADMKADGVEVIDPGDLSEIDFIPTGKGTHGIVVGHGGTPFYITNRGWHTTAGGSHGPGSVTVLDPLTRKIIATWPVPGGGSPDMGNVSTDGKELWVSGRYDREVYVFDAATGQLTHRIPVGWEPHGLCYWPQPGRFSLGHTGNMR